MINHKIFCKPGPWSPVAKILFSALVSRVWFPSQSGLGRGLVLNGLVLFETTGRYVYDMSACCRQCQLTQADIIDVGPEQCSAEFIIAPAAAALRKKPPAH